MKGKSLTLKCASTWERQAYKQPKFSRACCSVYQCCLHDCHGTLCLMKIYILYITDSPGANISVCNKEEWDHHGGSFEES